MQPSTRDLWLIKAVLFLLALVPLGRLLVLGYQQALGTNPIEFITRSTGTWTLVLLLVTLSVTPLRRLSGWNWLLRMRRMLGLFTFFYATLHLATYVWLDQSLILDDILRDIAKRPFVTAGMTAYTVMLLLALTSNAFAIRLLGGRRWQRLHRWVYFGAIAAVVHYWWLVKLDTREPRIYAAVLVILLGYRVWYHWRERQRLRAMMNSGLVPRRPIVG